ncbi:coagulation factor XIII B chain-like isoform X2 [Hyperolius riggenbachi]|uniref:coagulation factor XIII B chain-like isoform X2 n=1 Tax=Hyperolius riggenbachi TaxID=752182 RepID=UPI0035A27BC7
MLLHHCIGMFVSGFLAFLTLSLISAPATVTGEICNTPEVDNGFFLSHLFFQRSSKSGTYWCKDGFVTASRQERVQTSCTNNVWNPEPKCYSKRCRNHRVNNGTFYGLFRFYFSRTTELDQHATYGCDDGFVTPERKQLRRSYCTINGWNPEPRCLRICNSSLDGELNANIHPRDPVIMEGDNLLFHCYRGYETSDGATHGVTACLPSGQLSGQRCLGVCRPPAEISNGKLREQTKTKYLPGDRVFYDCDPGYTTGPANIDYITCEDTRWTDLACRKNCEAPPVVPNAEVAGSINSTYKSGSSVKYQCVTIYTLEGNGKITCINGTWEKMPICRGQCLAPKIGHGLVSPNIDVYDSGSLLVNIICDANHVLTGSSNGRCDRGQWSDLPQCLRPCIISSISLNENNLHLETPDDINKIHKHLTEVHVKCKENFRSSGPITASCRDGNMKYPRCFS